MHCPLPILRISKKIQIMERNATLLVIADDEGFKPDVEAWCKATGNKLVQLEENDGETSALIRKV